MLASILNMRTHFTHTPIWERVPLTFGCPGVHAPQVLELTSVLGAPQHAVRTSQGLEILLEGQAVTSGAMVLSLCWVTV